MVYSTLALVLALGSVIDRITPPKVVVTRHSINPAPPAPPRNGPNYEHGQFSFILHACAPFAIERSTDLRTWTRVASNLHIEGPTIVLDCSDTEHAFYRVVALDAAVK